MERIKIYVDKRECFVPDLLNDMCIVKKKNLHCADYILSKDIACERKTTEDFIQSIIDGRLFKQLKEMKKHFKKPLLIIEGSSFDGIKERNIHPNAVMGAIASIATDLSIPIIWTKNVSETSDVLFLIAKREQDGKGISFQIRNKKQVKSTNEEQEFLVAGLPNINSTLSKRLLKHFGTPSKIFAADEKELQKVKGVGKKLAKRIRTILDKEYEKSVLE